MRISDEDYQMPIVQNVSRRAAERIHPTHINDAHVAFVHKTPHHSAFTIPDGAPDRPKQYSAKNQVHLKRLSRRTVAQRPAGRPPLPDGPYDIVYADPPWFYYGSQIKDAAAAKHYPLMSQEELGQLPVRSIMAKRAALFLWATGPRLNFALELIQQWRLHYRGVAYVWVKTNRRGEVIRGQGVPPTFTKPTTEFVLAATTMPTGRPFPLLDLAQGQVVLQPRSEHSRKPAVFRRLIEGLCGDHPRIELFARESRAGWDAWGTEVGKFERYDGPMLFSDQGTV